MEALLVSVTFQMGVNVTNGLISGESVAPGAQLIPTPSMTVEATANASGGYIPPGTSEPFTDWWGVIKSTQSDAQYDDYFERQDLGGAINFGIDSLDEEIQLQFEAL